METVRISKSKPLHKGNDYNLKVEALTKFIQQSKTIDIIEHRQICYSFGLPYLSEVFRKVYDHRLLSAISEKPLTAATIAKVTGLQHKYICEVKRRLEKAVLLKVTHFGKCPTTGSNNVQFLQAVCHE